VKTFTTAAAIVLLASATAHSFVIGGSNLYLSDYPAHKCRKPDKPYKPYSLNDQYEVDSYNRKVRAYNRELEEYVDCLKKYADNAENDIERIKERVREAMND